MSLYAPRRVVTGVVCVWAMGLEDRRRHSPARLL